MACPSAIASSRRLQSRGGYGSGSRVDGPERSTTAVKPSSRARSRSARGSRHAVRKVAVIGRSRHTHRAASVRGRIMCAAMSPLQCSSCMVSGTERVCHDAPRAVAPSLPMAVSESMRPRRARRRATPSLSGARSSGSVASAMRSSTFVDDLVDVHIVFFSVCRIPQRLGATHSGDGDMKTNTSTEGSFAGTRSTDIHETNCRVLSALHRQQRRQRGLPFSVRLPGVSIESASGVGRQHCASTVGAGSSTSLAHFLFAIRHAPARRARILRHRHRSSVS